MLNDEPLGDLESHSFDEKWIDFDINNLEKTGEHLKKSFKETDFEALEEEEKKKNQYKDNSVKLYGRQSKKRKYYMK